MGKTKLEVKNMYTNYHMFIVPQITISRHKDSKDWLYLTGTASCGTIFIYRLYTGDDPKKIRKKMDIHRFELINKLNHLDFNIGEIYNIEDLINELGDIYVSDDVLPTYDDEGYQILAYRNPDNYRNNSVISTYHIKDNDYEAEAIIAALVVWFNKPEIMYDMTYKNPTSWHISDCDGETFINQYKILEKVRAEADLFDNQDSYILSLINKVCSNTYYKYGVPRYKNSRVEQHFDDFEITEF